MQAFINFFWNKEENRFRAFYRLIAFGVITAAIFPTRRYLLTPLLYDLPYQRIILIPLLLIFFLIAVWIAVRYVDRRRMGSIGFNIDKEWWINFSFGLFLGAFILSFVFLFEAAFGWIEVTEVFYVNGYENFTVSLIAGFLLYISVGIREETASRGYLIKNFSEGFRNSRIKPVTILLLVTIITSVLFGLGHANNPNATLVSTWNLMVIGILLAYAYIATGSLAMPIGIHITWNFFQGCVFGFPVSGHPTTASFLKIAQYGDDFWTGGSFGPEGGMVIYIASFIGFLMIYGWQKVRKGGAAPRDEIVEYQPFQSKIENSEL